MDHTTTDDKSGYGDNIICIACENKINGGHGSRRRHETDQQGIYGWIWRCDDTQPA